MPPKKHGNKKPEDEGFQAIVMSDSYQNRFMPLTLETPRCLLPLANTPLIEYTLEFLATAGVHEIYVIGSAHADQIEEYLANSKWMLPSSPFKVQVFKSPESQSVGDAMRDLDQKGLITSDFLLISGDIVSNIDFKSVLSAHRERKIKDKNSIMTMVLREASPLHRTRARSGAGLFVIDSPTSQCLRYESAPNSERLRSFDIDYEVISQHETISLRNDLIDCHIDICAPDIPALFTENFDYNDIRTDFVKGILTSELLGKTIYTHIIDDRYSARVESYQTYDAVSKDIISRYSYPITPEYNVLEDQTYHYQHGHIYKEAGVVLTQSCIIRPQSVIGSQTFIGEGTIVDKSVIGRRCKIGKNVMVENSYIWDDVVIEDNAVIKQSIIATGAQIKEMAKVLHGSVVSFGVVVGAGQTASNSKLTLQSRIKKDDGFDDDSDDEDEDESESENDSGDEKKNGRDQTGEGLLPLENGGVGYYYNDTDDSDFYYDSDEDDNNDNGISLHSLVYQMSNANLSDSSISSDSHGRSTSRGAHRHRRYSSMSAVTANSDDGEENFKTEAIASIERSIGENHDPDIAALELNTLRMTLNVQYHEVRDATITAFVNYVVNLVSTGTLAVKPATDKIFRHWGVLLTRQAFDDEDRIDLLMLLQHECSTREQGPKIMFYAVESLYDEDVIPEENIYTWFDSEASRATEPLRQVRDVLAAYVNWLRTADEESDSD